MFNVKFMLSFPQVIHIRKPNGDRGYGHPDANPLFFFIYSLPNITNIRQKSVLSKAFPKKSYQQGIANLK